jgi:hypothetical protein
MFVVDEDFEIECRHENWKRHFRLNAFRNEQSGSLE